MVARCLEPVPACRGSAEISVHQRDQWQRFCLCSASLELPVSIRRFPTPYCRPKTGLRECFFLPIGFLDMYPAPKIGAIVSEFSGDQARIENHDDRSC